MDVTLFELLNELFYQLGIILGVGSSTFAILFYIKALKDRVIDATEQDFLHAVYVTRRTGMVFIGFSLILFSIVYLRTGTPLFSYSEFVMEWILFGSIAINTALMTRNYISMKISPIIAASSWYLLFLISALPFEAVSYTVFFGIYGAILVGFFVVFSMLKRYILGEW